MKIKTIPALLWASLQLISLPAFGQETPVPVPVPVPAPAAVEANQVDTTAPPATPAAESTVKTDAASIAGNWMGLHPEWRGNIVFHADGTLVRPFFSTGTWELVVEEGVPRLALHWTGYGTEMLTITSRDQLRGQVNRGVFRLFRVASALVPNPANAEAEKTAAEELKERLKDSKWDLIDSKKFILHADGTVSNDFDESKGTWEFTAPNSLKIDVPWQPAPAKTVTTNCDATLLRWNYDETILAIREGS